MYYLSTLFEFLNSYMHFQKYENIIQNGDWFIWKKVIDCMQFTHFVLLFNSCLMLEWPLLDYWKVNTKYFCLKFQMATVHERTWISIYCKKKISLYPIENWIRKCLLSFISEQTMFKGSSHFSRNRVTLFLFSYLAHLCLLD